MRKIKSTHHVFLAVLLVIIGLTPWLDGYLFKLNYFHLVELINKDNRLKIDILDYKEGWLSSYAKVRVTLIDNELSQLNAGNTKKINFNLPVNIILKEKIYHGPVIYNPIKNTIEFGYASILTYLHISNSLDKTLLGGNNDEGLIQVSMLSKFDGDWRGQIQIPMITLSVPSIGKVVWYGLNGEFKMSLSNKSLKHMTINAEFGSLIMDSENKNPFVTQINIEPIQYTYDAAHERVGLWSGNTSMFTSGASIKMADGSVFVADDFYINTAFSATPTTFYNTNLTMKIKNLATPSHIIPVFSNVQITLSANDFSAKNINEYVKFIKDKTLDDMKDIDLKMIETILVRTIIPSSYFNIDASSDTSMGLFTSNSKITWKNASLPSTFRDVVLNSYTVINIGASTPIVLKIIEIYGKFMDAAARKKAEQVAFASHKMMPTKTTAPLPLAETPQQILDEMVMGGYLSKEKYGYSAILTVDNGIWKISGLVISPTQ